MTSKTQYVMVGLFVIALGATLISGVLWLGSGGPGRDYQTYVVYMTESVAGLSRDGAVKYRGVDVGRIHEIRIDPVNVERVRLLLEIEQGTPVREDTVATLEVQGLTGLGYINLVGGSQGAPALTAKAGEPHPVIPSQPSVWGRLDRSLGQLVDNLIEASQRLKAWLSDENQQLLFDTLTNLNQLSGAVASRSEVVVQALDDLAATMRNARDTSERLPQLIDRLETTAKAFEDMAAEIADTGSAVRDVVAARDRDLQRFSSAALPEAAAMIQELRQTAENFRHLSESLKRDPSVLLYGEPPNQPGPGE